MIKGRRKKRQQIEGQLTDACAPSFHDGQPLHTVPFLRRKAAKERMVRVSMGRAERLQVRAWLDGWGDTHNVPHLRNDLTDVLVLLLALDKTPRDHIHPVEDVGVPRSRYMALRDGLGVSVGLRRSVDSGLRRRLKDAQRDAWCRRPCWIRVDVDVREGRRETRQGGRGRARRGGRDEVVRAAEVRQG